MIGALSLVNKDVPDNTIVAGIPAKVMRIRTKEEIENDTKPYDVDHMYEYGQQAGIEMAIEIVKDIFNDFGF